MSATSASADPHATGAAPAERTLFGLDEAESVLLGDIFAESAAGLGVDGAHLYAELRRGKTVGQALGLPARITDILYGRAHTWFSAGRHDRAEALFRVLCVLDGRDADHWVGYGVCLRMGDSPQDAQVAFATAAALRPGWGVPHFHAAALAIAGERWSEAKAHLAAFEARQDPTVPDAMRREAALYAAALVQRSASKGMPGTGERTRP